MLIRSKEQLDWVSKSVAKAKVVAWDWECTGLSWLRDAPVGYSLAFDKHSVYIPTHPFYELPFSTEQALEPLGIVLRDESKLLVGHNACFDLHFNHAAGLPDHSGLVADTMVMHWLIDENAEHGLKELGLERLGILMTHFKEMLNVEQSKLDQQHTLAVAKWRESGKIGDRPIGRKATIFDVPIETLARYGAQDSEVTLKLFYDLIPDLKRESMWHLFWDVEVPFTRVLYEMESRGVRIDVDAVKRQSQEVADKLAYLEATLTEMAVAAGFVKTKNKVKVKQVPFNPRSTAHLKEVLFDLMKLKPTERKSRKTGESSLDEGAIKLLIDSYPDNEFLTMLLEYKKLAKLHSAFHETILEENIDGIIYANFHQTGTVTGRLSSSGDDK
jgi:DNA polymerase-1